MDRPSLTASLFERIRWTGRTLGVNERVILDNELLPKKIPEKTPFGRIRVDLEDGTYESVSATVVAHYNPYINAPLKGGIRMSDKVDTDSLCMLAIDMTFKAAVTNLRFGGAKTGIRLLRPLGQYSEHEQAKIIEAVAIKFTDEDIIGPYKYVPATDLGTTSEHMDIIYTAYATRKPGPSAGACVTGKGIKNGGLPFRVIATSRCGIEVLEELRKLDALPQLAKIKRPTVIVQGLGQVGGWFVRLIEEHGYTVVGVSNSTGAVYNPNGIVIDEIPKLPNASLSHMTGEQTDNTSLLVRKCDILVPAALENQLTSEIAKGVQASVILELANHPTTEEADVLFRDMGVTVIPDILANAGGVTASWKEYVLGLEPPHHELEMQAIDLAAQKHVLEIMRAATAEVLSYQKKYSVDLRNGAWLKAMDRIVSFLEHKHFASNRWPVN